MTKILSNDHHTSNNRALAATTLAALGVVFGDIGTSPLYALRECFHGAHAIAPHPVNILAVCSLILWSLITIVTIKYLVFVLRADNQGEGGILALMALVRSIQSHEGRFRIKSATIMIGIFGASLLYGDGMITPTISVLSAVEGLSEIAPGLEQFVVPITIVVLLLLFYFQKQGTAKIGTVFGPIITIWFVTIGTLGLAQILKSPQIIYSLNPYYGIQFFLTQQPTAFFILGSVFLAVTGGEALYADMGHFGRKPIQVGWFAVALPGLLLNYLGQGALLLSSPEAAQSPFYRLAPSWLIIPLVLLATMATVIASQALISGVFSLTSQAIQLGFLPRMEIRHTSSEEYGQIYIPSMNALLLLSTILLTLGFKTSSNLAAAYGTAVSCTMIITTVLVYFVMRRLWKWSMSLTLLVVGSFLIVEMVFLAANGSKFFHGGWFSILVAGAIFTVMTTWRKGRRILAQRLKSQSVSLETFLNIVQNSNPFRALGTAIFLTRNAEGIPPPLIHNLRHNQVLHQYVVLLTIFSERSPYVDDNERLYIEAIGEGLYRFVLRCGFMEKVHIQESLKMAGEMGFPGDCQNATFFLGAETVLPLDNRKGMAYWRECLFAIMSRNALKATVFYDLPPQQIIEVGLQVEF